MIVPDTVHPAPSAVESSDVPSTTTLVKMMPPSDASSCVFLFASGAKRLPYAWK